jgi:hypothetical protein
MDQPIDLGKRSESSRAKRCKSVLRTDFFDGGSNSYQVSKCEGR